MSSENGLPNGASNLLSQRGSRRAFLRNSAIAAAATGVLSACQTESAAQTPPAPTDAKPAGGTGHGGHAAPAKPAASPLASLSLAEKRKRADEMDALHEKGIKAFPAKTQGQGNQLMKPRVENGV